MSQRTAHFAHKFTTLMGLLVIVASTTWATDLTGTSVQNGALVIPKKDITSQASFFPVTVDGVKMEVLAVRASDGSVRTSLNTCQVCYNSGRGWYVQEGNVLVCQNCGNRFRVDQIEREKNGCNPVPITSDLKREDSQSVTIEATVLAQAKPLFARWKREPKVKG